MKLTLSALVLCAFAGSASAVTLTWAPIDGELAPAVAPSTYYTGIPGPYSAFAAASGLVGFDDYQSTASGPLMGLSTLRFVGGVTTAGQQARFNFYNGDGTPIAQTAFLAFPQGGDFIWNINFGTAALNNEDTQFFVPTSGFMEMQVAAGSTGRWFFTTTAPTVGTNNVAVGTGGTLNPPRRNAFELNAIPTPGAAALLGFGGLAAFRRRRTA